MVDEPWHAMNPFPMMGRMNQIAYVQFLEDSFGTSATVERHSV